MARFAGTSVDEEPTPAAVSPTIQVVPSGSKPASASDLLDSFADLNITCGAGCAPIHLLAGVPRAGSGVDLGDVLCVLPPRSQPTLPVRFPPARSGGAAYRERPA